MAESEGTCNALNAPQKPASSKRSKKSRKFSPYLLLVLLGILLLLYPIVGTLISDYNLNQINRSYSKEVQRIKPPTVLEKQLAAAEEYNRQLHLKEVRPRKDLPGDPDFENYMKQLYLPKLTGVMAQVKIPSINVNLPIYHTVSASVLYHGAGHMYGSDLPVGGVGTNAVISAHTGMVDATMFDNLPDIKNGDSIIINVFGRTLLYKVVDKQVVKPDDYKAIKLDPKRDLITLITCTPYGINSDRLIVTAERVQPVPPKAVTQAKDDTYHFEIAWWMWLDLAVIIAGIGFLWWLLARRRRKEKGDQTKK